MVDLSTSESRKQVQVQIDKLLEQHEILEEKYNKMWTEVDFSKAELGKAYAAVLSNPIISTAPVSFPEGVTKENISQVIQFALTNDTWKNGDKITEDDKATFQQAGLDLTAASNMYKNRVQDLYKNFQAELKAENIPFATDNFADDRHASFLSSKQVSDLKDIAQNATKEIEFLTKNFTIDNTNEEHERKSLEKLVKKIHENLMSEEGNVKAYRTIDYFNAAVIPLPSEDLLKVPVQPVQSNDTTINTTAPVVNITDTTVNKIDSTALIDTTVNSPVQSAPIAPSTPAISSDSPEYKAFDEATTKNGALINAYKDKQDAFDASLKSSHFSTVKKAYEDATTALTEAKNGIILYDIEGKDKAVFQAVQKDYQWDGAGAIRDSNAVKTTADAWQKDNAEQFAEKEKAHNAAIDHDKAFDAGQKVHFSGMQSAAKRIDGVTHQIAEVKTAILDAAKNGSINDQQLEDAQKHLADLRGKETGYKLYGEANKKAAQAAVKKDAVDMKDNQFYGDLVVDSKRKVAAQASHLHQADQHYIAAASTIAPTFEVAKQAITLNASQEAFNKTQGAYQATASGVTAAIKGNSDLLNNQAVTDVQAWDKQLTSLESANTQNTKAQADLNVRLTDLNSVEISYTQSGDAQIKAAAEANATAKSTLVQNTTVQLNEANDNEKALNDEKAKILQDKEDRLIVVNKTSIILNKDGYVTAYTDQNGNAATIPADNQVMLITKDRQQLTTVPDAETLKTMDVFLVVHDTDDKKQDHWVLSRVGEKLQLTAEDDKQNKKEVHDLAKNAQMGKNELTGDELYGVDSRREARQDAREEKLLEEQIKKTGLKEKTDGKTVLVGTRENLEKLIEQANSDGHISHQERKILNAAISGMKGLKLGEDEHGLVKLDPIQESGTSKTAIADQKQQDNQRSTI